MASGTFTVGVVLHKYLCTTGSVYKVFIISVASIVSTVQKELEVNGRVVVFTKYGLIHCATTWSHAQPMRISQQETVW